MYTGSHCSITSFNVTSKYNSLKFLLNGRFICQCIHQETYVSDLSHAVGKYLIMLTYLCSKGTLIVCVQLKLKVQSTRILSPLPNPVKVSKTPCSIFKVGLTASKKWHGHVCISPRAAGSISFSKRDHWQVMSHMNETYSSFFNLWRCKRLHSNYINLHCQSFVHRCDYIGFTHRGLYCFTMM